MRGKSEALLASEYRRVENLLLGLSKHRHQGVFTAFPTNGNTKISCPASFSARKRLHHAIVAVGFSPKSIAGTITKNFKDQRSSFQQDLGRRATSNLRTT